MWTLLPFAFGSSLLKQSLATAAGSSLLSSECREIGHSCTTFTPEPQPPPFAAGKLTSWHWNKALAATMVKRPMRVFWAVANSTDLALPRGSAVPLPVHLPKFVSYRRFRLNQNWQLRASALALRSRELPT